MGLSSALVDRATPVTREPVGAKVEGRTVRSSVEGVEFKCRLDFGSMGDTTDPAVGSPMVSRVATMLFAFRDVNGDPVTIDAGMRVRIVSRSLGIDELFDVAGDPEPIRKKKKMLAWQVEIRHVTMPVAAS